MNSLSPLDRLVCGIARLREIKEQAASGGAIASASEAVIFFDIEALAVQALIYLDGIRPHLKGGNP